MKASVKVNAKKVNIPLNFTPEEWKRIQADEMNNEEFGELFLAGFDASEPPLTDDEMYSLEENIQADADAINRRMALAWLTQSGKEMIGKVTEDRGFAVAIAGMGKRAEIYAEKLESLAGLMRAAATRGMVALCSREDMEKIVSEAEIY